MVTYLPTILMNIINQATNYIQATDKFSLVYTVNITCMMVLASVYLSVSSSLPTTSDIKPVEIWLLFNLAYPMLVILVNVILQVRADYLAELSVIILSFTFQALQKPASVKQTGENKQTNIVPAVILAVKGRSSEKHCIFYFLT